MTDKELATRDTATMAVQESMSIEQLVVQVQTIQEAMRAVMKDGEHFGTIPGTNKPTLLKPGAEKLLLLFRLGPRYRTEKTFHDDGHLTVTAICELVHTLSDSFVAEGEGMCSTKEAKYAWRNAQRTCPTCGVASIIKGKQEYGGGWVCFKRKDGCGAKFGDGDPAIVNQEAGRVVNPDLADAYNTVLKMACKRALIAAVLNGTAASDIFTQDLDERAGVSEEDQVTETTATSSRRASASTSSSEAPTEEAAPIGGPCPHCGAGVAPTNSPNDRAPKWRCMNDGCTGNFNKQKKEYEPWVSWNENPWKAGGEIETKFGKGSAQAEPTAASNPSTDRSREGEPQPSPAASPSQESFGAEVGATPASVPGGDSDQLEKFDWNLSLIEQAAMSGITINGSKATPARFLMYAQKVALRLNLPPITASVSSAQELSQVLSEQPPSVAHMIVYELKLVDLLSGVAG